MEVLCIQAADDTPAVLLDSENGLLEFAGKSYPEDASKFYIPIIEWVNNYIDSPANITNVFFKYSYYNTASAKKILDILTLLKKIEDNGKQIKVSWCYHKDDDDIYEEGQNFSKLVEMQFVYVEI